eukprot:1762776-Rhodomonas_salina.5
MCVVYVTLGTQKDLFVMLGPDVVMFCRLWRCFVHVTWPGTDLGSAGTRRTQHTPNRTQRTPGTSCPIALRLCYALSGTGISAVSSL